MASYAAWKKNPGTKEVRSGKDGTAKSMAQALDAALKRRGILRKSGEEWRKENAAHFSK